MLTDIINQINEKPPTILVVGDLMLDRFILGNVDRLSPEAPVPIVFFPLLAFGKSEYQNK